MKRVITLVCFCVMGLIQVAHAGFDKNLVFTNRVGAVFNFEWDGWKGKLFLATLDAPNSNAPPRTGILTSSYGYGYLVTSDNKIFKVNLNSFIDHHITFTVDFNNTPSFGDDQPFYGHIFTKDPSKFAGTTQWHGITFGMEGSKLRDWYGDYDFVCQAAHQC